MKHPISIILGVVLSVIVGLLLASESDETEYTSPREVRFTSGGFTGRPMTLLEQLTVWSAIESIATPPPDSITWTDAAGSTKTVSCSTFADLLTDQMNDSGRMETDVSSRQGKDHGHSGANHLSDGRATNKDQMNVDSQLIQWAVDSGGSYWIYLQETMIHEATHKWQSTSVMTSNEEELDALAAELAFKDSCGLDLSDWYYKAKFDLYTEHFDNHFFGASTGGSLLEYRMNGFGGYLRHNPLGDGVDYLVTNGPTGYNVNEYPLNMYGIHHAADMVTFDNHLMLPPDHCLAVTCGGDGAGTASINLLSIYQGELMAPVWDHQFGPAQGFDPMFFYCMTSWEPTGKWYVIDSTGHQILIMLDSQYGDDVPDEIAGTYASASWPGFGPVMEARSIEAAMHPEMGFGLIMKDTDKGFSDCMNPYDEFYFLQQAPAPFDSAEECVPVMQYEFLTFTPDVQYPLPWAGEDFAQVWGTWQHQINVWATDETGEIMLEMLGTVDLLSGVDAECSLSRALDAGEWLLAVDDVTGARLGQPTQVIDPTIDDLTINFDSNDGMLKIDGSKKCCAARYDLYSSDDGEIFMPTGDQSTDNHFEIPLPPMDVQFYQVEAVR